MQLDICQDKTVIPPLTFNDTTLERVSAFKLLGLWLHDNLKWQTDTDYTIGKAVNIETLFIKMWSASLAWGPY